MERKEEEEGEKCEEEWREEEAVDEKASGREFREWKFSQLFKGALKLLTAKNYLIT